MNLRSPRSPWRVLVALLAVVAMVAAACGDDDDDGGDSGSGDGGSAEFDGISVSVGSKDFTEQFVLGEILVAALEAKGADVDNQVNLGGTSVNREALLSGDIDMYWEYNGTGWTVHLGNEDPSNDPDELTENVREQDLEENGLVWLGQSPFNDTYGFATSSEFADENGPFDLQSMADYLEANSDATVCLETEFPDRPDGLVLFEEATGYEVPDSQINILDTAVIYTETAQGGCDFGEIFTTDGRIPALDLVVVEDPGVFILYNVSLVMPEDVYNEASDAYDTLVEDILAPLDIETMSELNRQVDEEGEDPSDVAQQYLEDQGII